MSFYTNLLQLTPDFTRAVERTEQQLSANELKEESRLQLLVKMAYCYSYVQLQKSVAAANEAIGLADKLRDEVMKGNAHCAKALSLSRIGYLKEAMVEARLALSVFEKNNYEEGMADAYFLLASMPYLIVHVGVVPEDPDKALVLYTKTSNQTGMFLVRILKCIHYYLKGEFSEGMAANQALVDSLAAPNQQHLRCYAYLQLSIGMYIKQDLVQFAKYLKLWQQVATETGNFHDLTMTKSMLADCYRVQHLDKEVMKRCIESIECCIQLGSFHGHSTAAIVMANICTEQGLYDDAIDYYNKAIDAAGKIEDRFKCLMAMNSIGRLLVKTGKPDEARKEFEAVLQEARLSGDAMNENNAQRYLGELNYELGAFDEALLKYAALVGKTGSEGWFVQDYGIYASCIAKATNSALRGAGLDPDCRQDYRLNYLQKFIDLATQQQNKREQANACNCLSDFFYETGNLEQALAYKKNYILLYEEIVNEQTSHAMNSLRIQYESEKKEQQIALLKKEHEQALLNERLRISRDLHDDMGATLSSISVYSAAVKQRLRNKQLEEAEAMLDSISSDAQEMVSAMDDMVWMINPLNDSMEKLLNRMSNYALSLFRARNIDFSFNVDDLLPQVHTNVEFRKNIFLVFKEAVNNAAKYSVCTRLLVSLQFIEKAFELKVEDNGIGFDLNTAKKGNGLANMNQRAGELQGKLMVTTAPGRGTVLSLHCPIPLIGG